MYVPIYDRTPIHSIHVFKNSEWPQLAYPSLFGHYWIDIVSYTYVFNLAPISTACVVTQLTHGHPQTNELVSIYFRYMD